MVNVTLLLNLYGFIIIHNFVSKCYHFVNLKKKGSAHEWATIVGFGSWEGRIRSSAI